MQQGNAARNSSALTRRILSAMGLFTSVESLNMFCSVVRTKLAALWLGSAGIGMLGLFNTVIELLGNISQLGVRTTAVRHIAASSGTRREQVMKFVMSYGRWLALLGIVIAIALSPLLSFITFGDFSQAHNFMMLSAAIGCNTLIATRSAVLQGSGQLKTLAKASVWGAVASLVLSVPFIYFWRMDGIVPLILTYSVVTLIAYQIFSRNSGATAIKLPPEETRTMTRTMIRLGVYLSVSGASGWLASYVIMSFLHYAGGDRIMGLYQAGYSITIRYVGVVFTALSLEYFPRLTTSFESGAKRGTTMLRHETMLSTAVVTALSAIMIPFAQLIVKILYKDTFIDIVPMIVLAAPGIVLRAVSFTMGYVILAKGRGKMYLTCETLSALVCIIATCGGYHLYGIPGLGAAFTLWYLAYTLMVWFIISHWLSVHPGTKIAVRSTVATVAVALVAASHFALPEWSVIIIGLIVSVSALLYMKK